MCIGVESLAGVTFTSLKLKYVDGSIPDGLIQRDSLFGFVVDITILALFSSFRQKLN